MKNSFFFTAVGIVLFAPLASKTMAQTNQNAPKGIVVLLQTTMGDIKLKLYDETPMHRDNFVKLVEEGYYDGLLFHRVINKFMIQGGDPDSRDAEAGVQLGNGGPGYTIPSEIYPQFVHKKGVLAAARTADQVNPTRASSGSQFYIVQGQTFEESQIDEMLAQRGIRINSMQKEIYTTVGGAPWLDNQYTIFGETIEGLDIIDKIAAVKTDGAARPEQDVKIIKASIVKK